MEMEAADRFKYVTNLSTILIQYAFDEHIRGYIDSMIPLFVSTIKDIMNECDNFDDYNCDCIIDKFLDLPDAIPLIDLVYFEVKHYYNI